jgi:hypothetical protein
MNFNLARLHVANAYHDNRITMTEAARRLRKIDRLEHRLDTDADPEIGWLGVTLFVLVVGAAALAAVR